MNDFLTETENQISRKGRFVVIIVPMTSCGTCIHGTLEPLSKNLEALSKTKVVITSYSTLKPVRIRYGKDFLENKSIIQDKEAKMSNYMQSMIQPVYVLFEHGKPIEYIEVNSSTAPDDFIRYTNWLSD